jgi:hypothetical protein
MPRVGFQHDNNRYIENEEISLSNKLFHYYRNSGILNNRWVCQRSNKYDELYARLNC